MRRRPKQWVEVGRIRDGQFRSRTADGCTGAFLVPGVAGRAYRRDEGPMKIISNTADRPSSAGWEHVSVSFQNRCPTWEEMSAVKDAFWLPDETVYQVHPPLAEYVSHYPYALHLWRSTTETMPRPPSYLVGGGAPTGPKL